MIPENQFIHIQLNTIHTHLMYLKFPYHSVSVIYRVQDLGLHVIFMEDVREMVTDELIGYLKANKFTHSFVKSNKEELTNILNSHD